MILFRSPGAARGGVRAEGDPTPAQRGINPEVQFLTVTRVHCYIGFFFFRWEDRAERDWFTDAALIIAGERFCFAR